MAVVEKDVKLVQTVKLSCSPSRPGALAWSQDDRIAVVTDQCVYILVSFGFIKFTKKLCTRDVVHIMF